MTTYSIGTSGLYYKIFTTLIYDPNDSLIVIYDPNDCGQYYKNMILANLAIARSVNYDRKTFIVQAIGRDFDPEIGVFYKEDSNIEIFFLNR
jgi:hypothetical protein